MPTKSILIVIISLFLYPKLYAQTSLKPSIQSKVIDGNSAMPLAYAQIYITSSGKGTISNIDGYFSMPNIPHSEEIRISYIGYQTLYITAEKLAKMPVVSMNKKIESLSTVNIISDDSYLYSLVSRCKNTVDFTPKTSKTYMQLQSTNNGKKIEVLEAYYNAEYKGYNVQNFEQKNGRFYLLPLNNSLYLSTETSIALYQHKLFYKNDFFPQNPLEFSKRKLQKTYDLKLEGKIKTKNSTIYAINYEPLKNSKEYFSGTIWIDSLSAELYKIDLTIDSAKIHPFSPLHSTDLITQISLRLSKNFEKIDGFMYLKSLDFDYSMLYQRIDSTIMSVESEAVMYAYDFENEFILPKFHFTDAVYKDYRNINSVPYNDFFWRNYNDFDFRYQENVNSSFTRNRELITNTKNQISEDRVPLFEVDFIPWSSERIAFKNLGISYREYYEEYRSQWRSNNFLFVDIYLDVNELNDSLHFVSKTIFNPYESGYFWKIDDQANACLNIYFDLYELERQKLDEKLKSAKTKKELLAIYDAEIITIRAWADELMKDLDQGMNRAEMKYRNKQIIDKLGIDNLQLFNIYQDSH